MTYEDRGWVYAGVGHGSEMGRDRNGQCARLALRMWSLGVMTQTSFKVLDTAVRSLDLILKVQVRA